MTTVLAASFYDPIRNEPYVLIAEDTRGIPVSEGNKLKYDNPINLQKIKQSENKSYLVSRAGELDWSKAQIMKRKNEALLKLSKGTKNKLEFSVKRLDNLTETDFTFVTKGEDGQNPILNTYNKFTGFYEDQSFAIKGSGSKFIKEEF